ncbi:TPA: Z1 domain-containing protein [Stenotrophomonas maltophilia]
MNEVEAGRVAQILHAVLQGMNAAGPVGLLVRLRMELEERDTTADVDGAIAHVLRDVCEGDASSAAHAVLAQQIRIWDAAGDAEWTEGTARLTPERRALVLQKLKLSNEIAARVDARIPVAKGFDTAVLIADDHQKWYDETRKLRTGAFYWDRYRRYLINESSWDEAAVSALDDSTSKVLECLSDPERESAYQVRGLVVGHVQSGKTANFTGVIAKAIDSGYRMVIVLAGLLDSLRYQTQRRLDKELVGKEQILRDQEPGFAHEYSLDQDWNSFTSYGSLPSKMGAFDIRRITTSVRDYQKLGQGKDVLSLERRFHDRPLTHRANLHSAAARLVVIKKHPAVIGKLISDLEGLNTGLDDFPVLVIDDESDQASVNTVNPKKIIDPDKDKTRTSTNAEIVRLLGMFPRSQYVGYTATPAANALVNVGDASDLFPRDFIELLPRPVGYMGVSDFHDFDDDFNPLEPDEVASKGYASKQKAFVRKVSEKEEEERFSEAIDAFFLSGAIKLFRAESNPRSVSTRHHTMLVHRSVRQTVHEEDRTLVMDLVAKNEYRRPSSFKRLWKLWLNDFEPVSVAQEPDLDRPTSLEQLKPFIDEALRRFESSKGVLVVNGDDTNHDDMPDFDKDSVWNILVGGSKLSRGYTVEGLTVTYFLRTASAADTLMQMGRWFGFRRGYRDLVRLYIGTSVSKGARGKVDLYELFESICMDEERFRKRIAEAYRDGIKPIQVPPLVPMGMLIPTQKNKMYSAEIKMENLGGRTVESGRLVRTTAGRAANAALFKSLLSPDFKASELVGFVDGKKQSLKGRMASGMSNETFIAFLKEYRWSTSTSQFASVFGFLSGVGDEDPCVDSWIVALLNNPSAKSHWSSGSDTAGCFSRSCIGGRFNVISESRHRNVAEHLVGSKVLDDPSPDLIRYSAPRQAVCLVYPTVPRDFSGQGLVADKEVSIGLSLRFPENGIRHRMSWSVKGADR